MINFDIPFRSNEDIEKYANAFLKKYWDKILPIDIELIANKHLRINIIPTNLKYYSETEAFLSYDFASILIDDRSYDNNYFRARFSIAHELGHYVLHKEYYKKFKFKNLQEYRDIYSKIPNYIISRAEIQSDIFAGFLLMPTDNIIFEINKLQKQNMEYYEIVDELSKIFEVSRQAIETRINKDNRIIL